MTTKDYKEAANKLNEFVRLSRIRRDTLAWKEAIYEINDRYMLFKAHHKAFEACMQELLFIG